MRDNPNLPGLREWLGAGYIEPFRCGFYFQIGGLASFARMHRRLETHDGSTGAAVAFKGFGKGDDFIKLL